MTLNQWMQLGGIFVFIVGMLAIAIRVFWWALDTGDYFQDKDAE
jgi:nitrogen fixation-related uncharacterized protein